MTKHTYCGGINQPAYYGCAGGCEMTYTADDLRTHSYQCWCYECWDSSDMVSETGNEYQSLPEFVPVSHGATASTGQPEVQQYSVVPHPKLKRDYKGRTVRAKRDLENAWGIIPAGTLAIIGHQSPKGSVLTAEECSCCGLKAIIAGIGMDAIEFVEPIAGSEP